MMKYVLSFCLVLSMIACSAPADQHNTLSDQEKKDGWTLLFDGGSLKGWHVYNLGNIPSAWVVDSGALICNPHAKNVKHGDLTSDEDYQNFDLKFDWKISKGGNSGVFINVLESPDHATAWATGPEFQLLDNANNVEHGTDSTKMAGSLYGITELKNKVDSKPFTEWNQGRILQQNGKITFWLNGVISVQEDINSDRWKELISKSSLGKFPDFAKATGGKIALQDWTNGVAFRDIKIKKL